MTRICNKRILLIGYGAMAREVLARLPDGVQVDWVIVPTEFHEALSAELAPQGIAVLGHISQLDAVPDLVLECAGHAALSEHGVPALQRGWRLAVVSVGALADAVLHQQLLLAAHDGRGVLQLLSGAVAGMDGLAAAREAGLDEVVYISRKNPDSWRGSAAEQMINLDTVAEATAFFEGNAGEAARAFPANANVAATIALNGLGLEATRVVLMVDPHTRRNTHRIHARGAFGEMTIELAAHPLPSNPKTSMLAALSAVRACRQLLEPVA